jgi:YqaJ-like viral recombinase domain
VLPVHESDLALPNSIQLCNKQFPITLSEAHQLEQRTTGQASSKLWFDERKNRITASLFGKVCLRKRPTTDAFLKTIFNSSKFSTAATDYGTMSETAAKAEYMSRNSKSGIHMHDCGLVVNPKFSFLGASPDGKICDCTEMGILEIKCPFSARQMTIGQAVEKSAADQKFKFCLTSDNGILCLKRNHEYFFQVQGQLMITGAAFCDFVVFTQLDMFVERIRPDIAFHNVILNKLTDFYAMHAIPYLTSTGSVGVNATEMGNADASDVLPVPVEEFEWEECVFE